MFGFMKKLTKLLPKEATLPGRKERTHVPERHFVNGNRIVPPLGGISAIFGSMSPGGVMISRSAGGLPISDCTSASARGNRSRTSSASALVKPG